jgi:superfamily II DNA or RNA helicase/HKD family nuclease
VSLPRGLYETLLTEALEARLGQLDARRLPTLGALADADAADRLALHVAQVLERAVSALPERERARRGALLARDLIARLVDALALDDTAAADGARDALRDERPAEPPRLLTAVRAVTPGGEPESIAPPLIPLLDTTLLTNAPGEPGVGRQLVEEIESADRVDIVMAFIRRSGIRPLLDALRRFTDSGRALRVLTTTYTDSTEAAALDALESVGAQVRVSYEQGGTRLHAKAFLFHRDSGFSTAYIGSSNLTHTAQVTGLEWNVRVSGVRNRAVVEKVAATFDSYWEGRDFVRYDRAEFDARRPRAEPTAGFVLPPTELRLEPFQERLLEQIALARMQGRHRNLLVAATGTGKTVMAAAWYARLRPELPRARLLFVAHRRQLLDQALATFRHALREHDFGELWADGERPERYEHVFASIQSLARPETLARIEPDRFDVVIVDEFHHAAADSYVALLDRLTPRELLGLTATPERADDRSVLDRFDGRIAAELRLWDAIDQRRLVPFAYYGVHDGLDLTQLPWHRGTGYDVDGLSNLLTANDAWARGVLQQIVRRTDGPSSVRAIGFCVSIRHAQFMARVFAEAGVAAAAVWADTTAEARARALRDLADGRLNVLFAVDLFNEGVDVPSVDTLLLLRPTDSPTLFMQQLGRGLRLHPGKASCTVLDFVGLHRREFRFDRRLRALLGGSRVGVKAQVERGFPFLPAGCHMELDAKARQVVLDNLRQGIAASRARRVEALRECAANGEGVRLSDFLAATGLDVEDVYDARLGWSDLCADAGLTLLPPGPLEAALRRGCGRLLHVDDPQRLAAWSAWVARPEAPDPDRLSERDRRLLRMLVASVLYKLVPAGTGLADGARLVWQHPQVLRELGELFEVLAERLTHLPLPLEGRPDVPLQVHARYTRIEILAAFGVGEGARVFSWQTGVYWAQQARADLLAFTLDKSAGSFSPNTRYRDYAIGPSTIHWESQSTTRAGSATGLRYQRHEEQGSDVMLFGRQSTEERAFHFLGPATYVDHRAEMPMGIRWRLRFGLPGDLFARYAAAAA